MQHSNLGTLSELRRRIGCALRRLAERVMPPEPITDQLTTDHARLARLAAEIEPLYGALYEMANDIDQAAQFAAQRTVAAFGHQWAHISSGKFMLSDPLFKGDVERIITEEEILIKSSWFSEKSVLDAGCGGGRWSYGLAKLGARVTAVDTNPSAIAATRAALEELTVEADFLQSDLESLHTKLPHESFDLVWSWGVLHHCISFTGALKSIARLVKPGGLIYMYLYGRESIDLATDIRIFKDRMAYNYLPTAEARRAFLLRMASGDESNIHHVHDIYAPLINRRFEFVEVRDILHSVGFNHVMRTIDHTEVWVRAVKGSNDTVVKTYGLPKREPPYWFQRQ